MGADYRHQPASPARLPIAVIAEVMACEGRRPPTRAIGRRADYRMSVANASNRRLNRIRSKSAAFRLMVILVLSYS
jgi:hypothetical protein